MRIKASYDYNDLQRILAIDLSQQLGKEVRGVQANGFDADGSELEDFDSVEIEFEFVEEGGK